MKIRSLLAPVFVAFLLSGCGQKDSAATGASASAAAPAPAATPAAGPRVIELTANDTMKFMMGDKVSAPDAPLKIEAKVGDQIKFVLTNAGTQPKESMGHNLVLLKPGSDPVAFSTASATAKDTDYVSAALKDQVLGNTPLLGPRKSGEFTVTFTAAGDYPFLCSFPAHILLGMKGVVTVK